WGLDPLQLHVRFWAAHGVQVVRQGEPSQIVSHAELFLLTDPRSLVLFSMNAVVDVMNWVQPQVLFLRVHDDRQRGYRERVVTDADGRFIRFQRLYDAVDPRLTRVVMTPEREIAQLWQSSADPLSGWRRLRRFIHPSDRLTRSVDGHVYDRGNERDLASYLHDLMVAWKRPDVTVARLRQHAGDGVWLDANANVESGARLIGPVWVGAGRRIDPDAAVVGPSIVWDDPAHRPPTEEIQWLDLEPTSPPTDPKAKEIPPLGRAIKRLFDLAFSLLALAITFPLYPMIMLAIWIEDGRPFFFSHGRETIGGRVFGCIKFRSMRKDAEKIKAQLQARNQADGPQFYMENDPRLTRVGAFLRKYNLDELPQFFNVLAGHMSVVGPRPSPFKENQFCPAWREARLSVRPGITGLWQINRTRRAGSDFQEWIKYDLEYVENLSWRLDLLIIWKTITTILRKAARQ
ncbi:MAG: sugar transferase, partial [Tepidisphaeraceae bacterium]